MLSWIFKKREASAAARPDAAEAAAAAEQAAQAKSRAKADAAAGWASRLAQARGDDAALLAVALEAPGAEIKRQAVAGITGEETLKRAEREFRTHDRRVHREAKQRLDAAVAQREARERADALIAAARALAREETIPLNRLVEIDRGWKALDARLLDDAQKLEFAALSSQLTALTHERGEQQQRLKRWASDAAKALTTTKLVCAEVVVGERERAELGGAAAELRRLIDTAPADASMVASVGALTLALEVSGQVELRLAMLDELAQPAAVTALVEPAVLVAVAPPVGAAVLPSSAVEAVQLAAVDAVQGDEAAVPSASALRLPESSPKASAEAPAEAAAGRSATTLAGADAPIAEAPLPATPHATPDASAVAPSAPLPIPNPAETPAPVATPASRWKSLPTMADSQLAAALDNRFDAWQRAQAPARAVRPAVDPRRAAVAEQRETARQQRHQERGAAVAGLVQQAEEALAAGHLAQAHQHLVAIDTALERGTAAEALRERIGVLHGEVARLKGWQHWSGGRARDDLVIEAETLAELIGGPRQGAAGEGSAKESVAQDSAAQDSADPVNPVDEGTAADNAISDGAVADNPQPDVAEVADAAGDAPAAAPSAGTNPAEEAAPVSAAAQPNPTRHPAPEARPPRQPKPPKVPVKELTAIIDDLRKRWKELDRLGGATSQTLWQRFDAALQVAYVPVAEHLARLKAARQENLEARTRLLEALDAVPLVQPGLERGAEAAAQPSEDDAAASPTTWKDQARALESFQAEWRKLGPVEHTVPHKARDRLQARLQASVARVEAPLQQARRTAQAERESLVARARALADEMAANPQSRDAIPRVRGLQAEWQQHAKSLPLARHAEGQLWADFKAATDAVFEQRDAAIDARGAQFAANLAAREALIVRLKALQPDSPAAEINRTLADVDAQWRNAGEAPRRDAAAVEARFRAAREAAQHHLANRAQRVWNATCDVLLEKLAVCESLEDAGGAASPAPASSESATIEAHSDGGELLNAGPAARWPAVPPLPAPWEAALARRRDLAASASSEAANAPNGASIDTLLLQLESGLDAPSPPAFQAARRDMKLRALKAALEGRQGASAAGEGVQQWMAALLGHPGMTAEQRERLRHVVAALRATGLPGSARS